MSGELYKNYILYAGKAVLRSGGGEKLWIIGKATQQTESSVVCSEPSQYLGSWLSANSPRIPRHLQAGHTTDKEKENFWKYFASNISIFLWIDRKPALGHGFMILF